MLGSLLERIIPNAAFIGVAALVLSYFLHRAFKNRSSSINDLLEKEMEANTSRSRDVEPEFFYTPDMSALPVSDDSSDENINKKQSQLIAASNRLMVRFPKKMTNLELKSTYGAMNLEKITGYEENYGRYTGALLDWAQSLLDHGGGQEKGDAIIILENAVELGSDYRKTYLLLADHYAEKSDFERLSHLADKVAESFSDLGIKKQLTNYIMDKKESIL